MEEEEIIKLPPEISNVSLSCNLESYTSVNDKILYIPGTKSIWNTILEESSNESDFLKYVESQNAEDQTVPQNPAWQYLQDHIFPTLIPLLEKTLCKAIQMDALKSQRNLFNGIDYISEVLWNTNQKYPERMEEKLNIYQMPWAQQILQTNPRRVFPKSWIWTPEIAATKIQSYMRGHFVRKSEEVQEMRHFWKILTKETTLTRVRTSFK